MGSLIFILAPAIGAMCLATGFVIALGIVAARADEHFDRQLAEERAQTRSATSAYGPGLYAPPPEVSTAMAVASTTSVAVIPITKRSPPELEGKSGRLRPIPIDNRNAHTTSAPPTI